MTVFEYVALIQSEVTDLAHSVSEYETMHKHLGTKPYYGDGSVWKEDSYGVPHCEREGLSQGSTTTAIERKIITIREHLNDLRKLVR